MFYSASIGANLHITMMNTEAEIDWPVQSKIRAPLFAVRTLNPKGQYRVILSLR